MSDTDSFNLARYLDEQETDYSVVINELRKGRKDSHWMWYVFPQVVGLGFSSMAQDFAIRTREEAVEYLNHDILGSRLIECCEALLEHSDRPIREIMGEPDDLKLRSSMTLFSMVEPSQAAFQSILNTFYDGAICDFTASFLSSR